MPRPIQDSTADDTQRRALRHFAARLGLDVEDLEPPRGESANVAAPLTVDELRDLRDRAHALGTSAAVLVRGLVRSWLRAGLVPTRSAGGQPVQ